MRVLPCILVLLMPLPLKAALIINEVAWMGTAASANDEWIELYNSGSQSQLVDGWTLTDGQDLTVQLSGTISVGEYVVLERTDDESAPGTAFLIYTGNLRNSGAVLSLFDAAGTLVDQVVGGENWKQVGGDNVTKATAQYTGEGWLTATATPGAATPTAEESAVSTESDASEEKDDDVTITSSRRSNSTQSKKSVTEPATLTLNLVAPSVAYVNQPLTMVAQPSGSGSAIRESLQYQWNFGDLTTDTGSVVEHSYAAPGEYVIHLQARYKTVLLRQRHIVTVLPVSLELSRTPNGLVLENQSEHEVDLSDYTLFGTQPLRFPSHTYLLPGSALTIDESMIRSVSNLPVTLYDQANGQVAQVPADTAQPIVTQAPGPPVRLPLPPVEADAGGDPPAVPTEQPIVLSAPDQSASADRPGIFVRMAGAVRGWFGND